MNHPLLDQLIDYAGLFPPAGLEMGEAVPEYVAHLAEPEAWILGRFICPVDRLPEMLPHASLFEGSVLRLSVLPGSGSSLSERVRDAVSKSEAFQASFRGTSVVEVFEARVAEAIPSGEMAAAADAARSRTLYLEWQPDHPDLVDLLSVLARVRRDGSPNLGAKIRCGGTTHDAFPSVEHVARFIGACVKDGIPFKATAGLHHPIRHDRDGFTMHGFLNVFGATVLSSAHGLDATALEPIVAERDPTAFDLSDGFAWRDLRTGIDDVLAARQLLAHGFGSCSFNEPREDLEEAHWFGLSD